MLAFSTNSLAGFSADELAVLNDAYRELLAERLDEDGGDWYREQVARATREHVLVTWVPGITAAAIVAKVRAIQRRKRGA